MLMRHYDHTYVVPGERFPRRRHTDDPVDRDVRTSPAHDRRGQRLHHRRRRLLRRAQPGAQEAVRHPLGHARGHRRRLESAGAMGAVARRRDGGGVGRAHRRYPGLPARDRVADTRPARLRARRRAAESGRPGRCSRSRRARSPGRSTPPAATGPLVVLANLSGFDGSPESMRHWQLEYGAEIGRAVTNFRGPDRVRRRVPLPRRRVRRVLQAAQRQMEIAAVEGSYASVIGGAPAAGDRLRPRGQRAAPSRTRASRACGSGWRRRSGAVDGPARHAARDSHEGAVGEARRGRRRVRRDPHHPAGARRGLGRPDHRAARPAAIHHRRARAGHGPRLPAGPRRDSARAAAPPAPSGAVTGRSSPRR